MSNLPALQYYYDVDFEIVDADSYKRKYDSRKPTHDSVLNTAQDTVNRNTQLTLEQKNEVKQVFLTGLRDLAEYGSVLSWVFRKAVIADHQKAIRREFKDWQQRLGGQLGFTWDDLLEEAKKTPSASTTASTSMNTGRTGTVPDAGRSFFSGRS